MRLSRAWEFGILACTLYMYATLLNCFCSFFFCSAVSCEKLSTRLRPSTFVFWEFALSDLWAALTNSDKYLFQFFFFIHFHSAVKITHKTLAKRNEKQKRKHNRHTTSQQQNMIAEKWKRTKKKTFTTRFAWLIMFSSDFGITIWQTQTFHGVFNDFVPFNNLYI